MFRPGNAECLDLVNRIIASKDFHRANRLKSLLLYIVDRSLAGATADLAEVAIGQRVFSRPEIYNPGEDSIVRSQARILRQRLESYFAGEGRDELLLLQIPKGAYIAVFHPRDVPPEKAVVEPEAVPEPAAAVRASALPSSLSTRRRWLYGCAAVPVGALATWYIGASRSRQFAAVSPYVSRPEPGRVRFESSDVRLVKAFRHAKECALDYSYTGDPVGEWYDSTVRRRYAFCQRDVAHQSTGAAVLGLGGHTQNMLRRFAGSISRERNWCSFWEINKDGFPSPADYRNDSNFWYCLPGNFDLMHACYRQYLWSGDRGYFDAVFSGFYDATVTRYVRAWDQDNDGLMESGVDQGRRGIPSYWQGVPRPLIGGDLLAAQYAGYRTYARIQHQKGPPGSRSHRLAEESLTRAEALRVRFNSQWWDASSNHYYSAMMPDHTYSKAYLAEASVFGLLFELMEDGTRTEGELDRLEKNRAPADQALLYFPEVLFQYGRNESAYGYLLELTDPEFRSWGIPEAVFSVVGAIATGLMGISPDAAQNRLETLPRLPKGLDTVALTHMPVLGREVTVRHQGATQTSITNEKGPAFEWRASFQSAPGPTHRILVDNAPVKTTSERRGNLQKVVSAVAEVKPGQTRTARYLDAGA